MHVFFLARWYPNKFDPMLGLFIERHALAVSKFCKVSVLFIYPDEQTNRKYELDYKIENNIHVLRVYYKKSILNSPFPILNCYRYIKCNYLGYKYLIKQSGTPDIIHVNVLTRAGLLALFLNKFRNITYIITEHWSRYLPLTNSYKGFVRKIITKLIVKNASALTTVTSNLKEAMLKHNLKNDSYFIIPNAVDTDLFFPEAKSAFRNPQSEIIKIIHISCFEDKSKNISGILRVIKRLSEIRQDFELRLIGDGIDKTKLEKYAEELGINDKFAFFDGLLVDNALAKAIQVSDFLVMFSNYENMPVVINESLSCGVPVISSNVGGIAEHVTDKFGILVKAGDEDALLNAILKMMDDYKKYSKEDLREYATKKFSMEIVGNQFVDIYNNCIN